MGVPIRAILFTGARALNGKSSPMVNNSSATPISASSSISCTSPTVGPPVFGPTSTPARM